MKLKLKHRKVWMAFAVPLLGSCVAVLASLIAVEPLAAQEQMREGECEQADVLFPDNNPGPGSLKQIAVPEPTNLGAYVRNRQVAIALGKALFWDMQVGSDGATACATCHFRAGADPRSVNQLNPGGPDNPKTTIDLGGPNYHLQAADFPLHKLADPTDRNSRVQRSIDDVVSSQGVHLRQFVRAQRGAIKDETRIVPDPVFNIGGINTRRAEPRNTPTMINAAFTLHNFWDRRAKHIFNGVSVHGAGDSGARVLRADGLNRIVPSMVRIHNASLASQAVGPPLSDREMGSLGRTFKDIGKRLASARPLRQQKVAGDDSVLGPYAVFGLLDRGLVTTYQQMIETAFQPTWWRSNLIVRVGPNGSLGFVPRPFRGLHDNEYTMLEHNFALFFGLAVQLYEMTLISNDAPIDRFFEGDLNAMTEQERRGMAIFTSETANTACSACHSGAELTDNSRRILDGAVVDGVKQPAEWSERMFNGQCKVVAYDQGIYNIGVRPTEEDLGSAATIPSAIRCRSSSC